MNLGILNIHLNALNLVEVVTVQKEEFVDHQKHTLVQPNATQTALVMTKSENLAILTNASLKVSNVVALKILSFLFRCKNAKTNIEAIIVNPCFIFYFIVGNECQRCMHEAKAYGAKHGKLDFVGLACKYMNYVLSSP